MNDANEHHTATRYCHCYTPKQVNRTIHVCRKCGKQIYKQDVLKWWQVTVILAVLMALWALMAYAQQNWNATP